MIDVHILALDSRGSYKLFTSNLFQKYRIRCNINAAVVDKAKYENPARNKNTLNKTETKEISLTYTGYHHTICIREEVDVEHQEIE